MEEEVSAEWMQNPSGIMTKWPTVEPTALSLSGMLIL